MSNCADYQIVMDGIESSKSRGWTHLRIPAFPPSKPGTITDEYAILKVELWNAKDENLSDSEDPSSWVGKKVSFFFLFFLILFDLI